MTFWAETGVTFGLVTGVTLMAQTRRNPGFFRGVTLWPSPRLKQGCVTGLIVTFHTNTVTGRFVKKSYVDKHPKTTIIDRMKVSPSKKR